MATLSIVATPIGNLGDITLRALETLKGADLILCEDTRVTKKLLSHYGISIPAISYHAHSKISKTDKIISFLKEGKKLALVSDAGTPGISDPGSELVRRIREEMSAEVADGTVKIEAVPGPSALVAALAVAGVPCSDFVFLGFLPHKKGRETLFREIAASDRAVIFYESPHRIMKSLQALAGHLAGLPREVTVCRELTKVFEEVVKGSPEETLGYFSDNPEKVRGEFVVIVSPTRPAV